MGDGRGIYVSAWIFIKVAQAGNVEIECAGDFLGICQDGIDVIV